MHYGHLTGLNRVALPRWFYFLGLQPDFHTLRSLEEAQKGIFQDRNPVSRDLVGQLSKLLRDDRRAVLVEGPKGSGKSCTTLLALRELYSSKCEDRFPIYWLNGQQLRIPGTAILVKQDLAQLPQGTLLFFDDLHREPTAAVDVAVHSLERCKARLVFVSRPAASDEYERLRQVLTSPNRKANYALFSLDKPGQDLTRLCRFVGDILMSCGKPSSEEHVNRLATLYGDDLTALFDAIEQWRPGEPITPEVADWKLRQRMERDPDFEIQGKRDQALAAFLAAAVFWQFEIEVGQDYLGDGLGLGTEVAEILAQRGVLIRHGEAGARRYALDDHELRARRYVRVAAGAPDFTQYLRHRFQQRGIASTMTRIDFVGQMLLIDLLGHAGEQQVERLTRLNQLVVYAGYKGDYVAVTETFRRNKDLLGAAAQVEVLTQGGGVRRRQGMFGEAQAWLEEARTLGSSRALGKILYEEAYLVYYGNEFDHAARLFENSARATQDPVGKQISLAKAAEARFQAMVLGDSFSRNLEPGFTFGERLAGIRGELETSLRVFREFCVDSSLSKSQTSNAGRWVSNCLVHLADLCLEQGDIGGTRTYLERERTQIHDAKHFTITPVVEYLDGRLELVEGNSHKAVHLLSHALEGYDRLDRYEGRGDLLVALGDAYLRNSDREPARRCYLQAQDLGPAMRNGRAAATAQHRLSRCQS